MASITFRNGVKRYGDNMVIQDMNLDIADKEFVLFVGPSGCGNLPACVVSRFGRDQSPEYAPPNIAFDKETELAIR